MTEHSEPAQTAPSVIGLLLRPAIATLHLKGTATHPAEGLSLTSYWRHTSPDLCCLKQPWAALADVLNMYSPFSRVLFNNRMHIARRCMRDTAVHVKERKEKLHR